VTALAGAAGEMEEPLPPPPPLLTPTPGVDAPPEPVPDPEPDPDPEPGNWGRRVAGVVAPAGGSVGSPKRLM